MDSFYELTEHIRRGGHIIVPKSTYWHMPYGVSMFEILAESIGLRIESPHADDRDVLIITVE